MVRVEAAVKRVNAKRVVLDSIGSLLPQFADAGMVRREVEFFERVDEDAVRPRVRAVLDHLVDGLAERLPVRPVPVPAAASTAT